MSLITEHLNTQQHKQWVHNVSEAELTDSLNQMEEMTMPYPVNHPDYLDVRIAYEELMEVCMSGADGHVPALHVFTYLARFLHQLKIDPRVDSNCKSTYIQEVK